MQTIKVRIYLFATTMHDYDLAAHQLKQRYIANEVVFERIVYLRGAAVFDDENFIAKFLNIRQGRDDDLRDL